MKIFQKRRHPEEYDIHNRKKPRIDYPPEFHQRPGFVKDPRYQEVDRRFTGVRRDVFLNGSYNDYVREFHNMGPPTPWQGMHDYDMRVDDFLRRTQAVVSGRRSRPRERERERERPRDNRRERGRDRERERMRDRDRGDRGRYRR